MNHHLTLKEKANLLENTTCLTKTESLELAQTLDCCPFAELREISEAIEIMSKGHDE